MKCLLRSVSYAIIFLSFDSLMLNNWDLIIVCIYVGRGDEIQSENVESPVAAAAAAGGGSHGDDKASSSSIPQKADMITCYPSMKGIYMPIRPCRSEVDIVIYNDIISPLCAIAPTAPITPIAQIAVNAQMYPIYHAFGPFGKKISLFRLLKLFYLVP